MHVNVLTIIVLIGRADGLVHVSQIRREGRIVEVGDVVKRGQRVRVKVLTVAGNKISLSMKDVDQVTGEDLAPQQRQRQATGANAVALGMCAHICLCML